MFALPPHLSDKAAPARIAADERRFAAIATALTQERAGLERRRAELLRTPARHGEAALERDLAVHRITARLRILRRFGIDACLGRLVHDDGSVQYIGRFGISGEDGEVLLMDWRTPAAEPFFAATLAHRNGVRSRRRYRWRGGAVIDYGDEIFDGEVTADLSPDDQSAFIASLGATRSSRMRDVLGTIQADQDAIIRAPAAGALVVDGGPGTGKTVVALHRAAYLQYADPRLGPGKGGILVVGPHTPYLAYVEDVLPSLGEEGVLLCTPRDLVPEGATAGTEEDPRVARLKGDACLLDAVEPAVRVYEQPPTRPLLVETPWSDLWVTPQHWADAFATADRTLPHNDARDQVWEELLDILVDEHGDVDGDLVRVHRALARDEELGRAFRRAWPILDPARVVADLYRVPSYLQECAPFLTDAERALLRRPDPAAWTTADLPLLDEARARIGDPEEVRRRHRRAVSQAAEREVRARVVEDLVAADDSDLKLMSILTGQDAENSLLEGEEGAPAADAVTGTFAHLIIDEAQELTDAQWRMLLRRCPSRSVTVVGDRAQAREGFPESWEERLSRLGLDRATRAELTINYRTPAEVMEVAAPVIRAALADANVPVSVRATGVPVRTGVPGDLDAVLGEWLTRNEEGIAVVVGAEPRKTHPRVRSLSPWEAKGLEFDLVVLVDPDRLGAGLTGAVDRYVAMTRATRELVVLSPAATDG
ncbi:RNA polymerase recycling motor ATPase HelR [Microbacterium sp. TNHR37B]|uniref:RNA polymerase recycling motor ATPase HelR n=1 Tax=Microbacterium sp. TNHR37B TaxID=1775956 RepID=UPI0007B1F7BD|nr:RNA polymerase recycling motor ATPase HelR [Microbacterium sp. TNHR37B]KZE88590.1 Helicase IV [Microbacterium sp. TNHR37B]